MGTGWLRVQARALHRDASLASWLDAATGYLARLEPKRTCVARAGVSAS